MGKKAMGQAEAINIWGVPFAQVTLSQTIERVEELVRKAQPSYFMTVNLHTTMLASRDHRLRQVIRDAAFVVADGMPLVWASRLHERHLPERVAGADLLPAVCERAAMRGWRLFFLGGPPGVGEEARARLITRFSGLEVVGVESPPYRPMTAAEEAELVDRIRAKRPDILIIALGQPHADFWIHERFRRLGVPVCVNLGASLDFAAGRISRAPKWLQRSGFEWAYRLAMEPRRLFVRYYSNIMFVFIMLSRDLRARRIRTPDPKRPTH